MAGLHSLPLEMAPAGLGQTDGCSSGGSIKESRRKVICFNQASEPPDVDKGRLTPKGHFANRVSYMKVTVHNVRILEMKIFSDVMQFHYNDCKTVLKIPTVSRK